MATLNADDTNEHFVYSSGWAVQTSDREYGGGSHCTDVDGASVTLRFRGKYLIIHSTVPASTSPTFSDYSRIDMKLDDRPVAALSMRAFPTPVWDHPIYESSGLPETDHVLTLTFRAQPDTVAFCLDRVYLSSNIGSAYVPELLDPVVERREMAIEDIALDDQPIHTVPQVYDGPTLAPLVKAGAQLYTLDDVQTAACAGAAVGGLVVGIFMLLCMVFVTRRRRNVGELKI